MLRNEIILSLNKNYEIFFIRKYNIIYLYLEYLFIKKYQNFENYFNYHQLYIIVLIIYILIL